MQGDLKTNLEPEQRPQLDLEAVREKLASANGPEYWRSLEELAELPEFQAWVDDEFPNRASLAEIDRRHFLKFMGASLVLAGVSGCRFLPQERVIPYVRSPEDTVLGRPTYYASACTLNGYATGVLVKSLENRPTKIEGNPDHPTTLGACDIYTQASLLGLYDPDRSQYVADTSGFSTWDEVSRIWGNAYAQHKQDGGAGLRILTEEVTSPTEIDLMNTFLAEFPQAKWAKYSPTHRDSHRAGTSAAFGQALDAVYLLDQADVIVSLDADLFAPTTPGNLLYNRQWSSRRIVSGDTVQMSRLYVLESTSSITGAVADHRIPMKPSQIEAFARSLAAKLGIAVQATEPTANVSAAWMNALVSDLMASRGRAVVVPGEYASPAIHALAAAINSGIGAVGSTVRYIRPVQYGDGLRARELAELTQEMRSGAVQTLIVLGANPVYDAPSDLGFFEAMRGVKLKIHHGLYADETGLACDWHMPETHYLEAWGDARAIDGTASIVQPLIAPIFEGRSKLEMISLLSQKPAAGYDLVRSYWKRSGISTEADWQKALNAGIVAGTTSPAVPVTVSAGLTQAIGAQAPSSGIEATILPDIHVFDGRFANNSWLRELPKPMTTLTWDNAVLMSPKTGQGLGLRSEDHVTITVGNRKLTGPAWLQPGHPDDTVTLQLGYGRKGGGRIAVENGFDLAPIRTSEAMWTLGGATLKKGDGRTDLASAQMHSSMQGRDIIRSGTVSQYLKNKTLKPEVGAEEKPIDMFDQADKETAYDGYKWAMTIDMNLCTGCNACVMACVAENNIPVVGKREVQRGREMHWIRIDRYFRVKEGAESRDPDMLDVNTVAVNKDVLDPGRVEVEFQPVMCVHCEKAPCEPVCPVAATIHSEEGLNQMVYNRCVGTRYCSNNCPYKVRRFNFFNYTDNMTQFAKSTDRPLLKMLNNPEVTVRGRGVMEKCTYCVQRINEARIESKKEGRKIQDGMIVTACQQACPTNTIVFGDLSDRNSRMSKIREEPRSYMLLSELNTRPRTKHLARLRNPHPELEKA